MDNERINEALRELAENLKGILLDKNAYKRNRLDLSASANEVADCIIENELHDLAGAIGAFIKAYDLEWAYTLDYFCSVLNTKVLEWFDSIEKKEEDESEEEESEDDGDVEVKVEVKSNRKLSDEETNKIIEQVLNELRSK